MNRIRACKTSAIQYAEQTLNHKQDEPHLLYKKMRATIPNDACLWLPAI